MVSIGDSGILGQYEIYQENNFIFSCYSSGLLTSSLEAYDTSWSDRDLYNKHGNITALEVKYYNEDRVYRIRTR